MTARSQGNTPAVRYDVKPRSIDLIAPGTVIEKDAPKGWSHLILKSQPRAGTGDVKMIAKSTAQYAGLLFTAIVADVEPGRLADSGRYRLAGLALGMGSRVNGKDIILSADKQASLGANFGFIERSILSQAHDKLRAVLVVARSDTMALFDAPNWLQRNGKHDNVILRYAVLVDPATGNLETLLWVIDRDGRGGYKGTDGLVEWLAPAKQDDCVLHVDANEFTLGIPSDRAFALERIPQGQKQLAMPDDLKQLAGRSRPTAEIAQQIEVKLREVLSQGK
jgi:hypothetical protein